jgi:hypothetical protein
MEAATSSDIHGSCCHHPSANPISTPTRLHLAREARQDGQVERAERADGGGLRGRADPEQDDGEHDHGQHSERDHGDDQLFENLELLSIHAPEVGQQQQDEQRRRAPEPRVEMLRDLAG